MSKSLKQMAYDTIEAHQETIADLRTQLAKANESVEELQEALVDDSKAKTMLNKLAMENGELNIKASGNIFHVFCETFVETFKAAGATNYLVAEFNSEELGAFTVTMQRSEGLTVYQKLNEANERVRELEQFQQEIAYRCFLEGLNTEKPREPNAENRTATAINHFAVEVDRYARGASRSILEQLRKEQE